MTDQGLRELERSAAAGDAEAAARLERERRRRHPVPARNCEACGSRTKVTKVKVEGNRVVRRRGCPNCGKTFSTVERRSQRGWEDEPDEQA